MDTTHPAPNVHGAEQQPKKGEKGMNRNINIKGMSREQWLKERKRGDGGAETSVRWHGESCPAYYADGQAHVWDPVAGYYTTCHSLTERQIARVRRLANRD